MSKGQKRFFVHFSGFSGAKRHPPAFTSRTHLSLAPAPKRAKTSITQVTKQGEFILFAYPDLHTPWVHDPTGLQLFIPRSPQGGFAGPHVFTIVKVRPSVFMLKRSKVSVFDHPQETNKGDTDNKSWTPMGFKHPTNQTLNWRPKRCLNLQRTSSGSVALARGPTRYSPP